MTMNDTLAAGLSKIMNAERIGRKECIVAPSSKTIKKVLELMNQEHYIGSFEEVESSRGKSLKVNLIGGINDCGVIKPRFSVKRENMEKYEKRYLPAKDFGFLIVSTTEGLMPHTKAKKKNLGGRLIAYCY